METIFTKNKPSFNESFFRAYHNGSFFYAWDKDKTRYFSDFDTSPLGDATPFFVSDYLTYGDYDSSCEVERSNVRYMADNFPDEIKVITGGYGSTAVIIPIPCYNAEIIETLNGLENYPAISDEYVHDVRVELIQEAIESTVDDLVRKIERKYDVFVPVSKYNVIEAAFDIFNYAEIEAGGLVYVDIEAIIYENISIELINKIKQQN